MPPTLGSQTCPSTLSRDAYGLFVYFFKTGKIPSTESLVSAGIYHGYVGRQILVTDKGTLSVSDKCPAPQISSVVRVETFLSLAEKLRLSVRQPDTLECISTGGIVVPLEDFPATIMFVHTRGWLDGPGHRGVNNSINEVKKIYSVGEKHFGLSEADVRRVILGCPDDKCIRKIWLAKLNTGTWPGSKPMHYKELHKARGQKATKRRRNSDEVKAKVPTPVPLHPSSISSAPSDLIDLTKDEDRPLDLSSNKDTLHVVNHTLAKDTSHKPWIDLEDLRRILTAQTVGTRVVPVPAAAASKSPVQGGGGRSSPGSSPHGAKSMKTEADTQRSPSSDNVQIEPHFSGSSNTIENNSWVRNNSASFQVPVISFTAEPGKASSPKSRRLNPEECCPPVHGHLKVENLKPHASNTNSWNIPQEAATTEKNVLSIVPNKISSGKVSTPNPHALKSISKGFLSTSRTSSSKQPAPGNLFESVPQRSLDRKIIDVEQNKKLSPLLNPDSDLQDVGAFLRKKTIFMREPLKYFQGFGIEENMQKSPPIRYLLKKVIDAPKKRGNSELVHENSTSLAFIRSPEKNCGESSSGNFPVALKSIDKYSERKNSPTHTENSKQMSSKPNDFYPDERGDSHVGDPGVEEEKQEEREGNSIELVSPHRSNAHGSEKLNISNLINKQIAMNLGQQNNIIDSLDFSYSPEKYVGGKDAKESASGDIIVIEDSPPLSVRGQGRENDSDETNLNRVLKPAPSSPSEDLKQSYNQDSAQRIFANFLTHIGSMRSNLRVLMAGGNVYVQRQLEETIDDAFKEIRRAKEQAWSAAWDCPFQQ